ncbi:hypothetical protein O0I10_005358 [Lichtheimia ornata]|uniref:Uncharacterized protein n=1 Tax=Lichtheimia ornata TaxID=688661 RepID=A0AAD7V7G6_9FUNG|nr:uncharacterized protein O0I10_005358 [Lichtheimia ornata]KAJ8658976.1 hypothetical protein O0I10_005358 [Lichtheimia ornata]
MAFGSELEDSAATLTSLSLDFYHHIAQIWLIWFQVSVITEVQSRRIPHYHSSLSLVDHLAAINASLMTLGLFDHPTTDTGEPYPQ